MSEPNICIIDYGVGNLHNLRQAFRHQRADAVITEDAAAVAKADALVLPGVGAFASGMEGLKRRGLMEN